MSGLIFDEASLLNNNIFAYEKRLFSASGRYIENGGLLTSYYQIREDATTVDRGIQDIEALFGHRSPLRFNHIKNFPVYGFGAAVPNNTNDVNIEDISVEGECIIFPSTIVPHPNDFFIINHLKMNAIFQVVAVQYDSMKIEGYYKINYRLHSTSNEVMEWLNKQTVETYHTDLNALGTELNPIIKEDNFIFRQQISQMTNKMIDSYKSLFYNDRHNCFLYGHNECRLFDCCGNEFIAKHSLMNATNSNKVIVLHDKLHDNKFSLMYNNSIYSWLELDAPLSLIQKFPYELVDINHYRDSSFYRWSDYDIKILCPNPTHKANDTYFDTNQLTSLMEPESLPANDYERLIHKFIHNSNTISIADISLNISQMLFTSINTIEVYLYTPIILYIIRKIMRLN
jgi:hypothetical protein